MSLPEQPHNEDDWQTRLHSLVMTAALNRHGRLRALWRFLFFIVIFYLALSMGAAFVQAALTIVLGGPTAAGLIESIWGFALRSVVLFVPAALIGWACAELLEDLPWRSLGWALHQGWLRDLLLGLGLAAASTVLVAVMGLAFGGYRFTLNESVTAGAIIWTLVISGFIFMLGSAAEEMLFRGYLLQTLLRSWPAAVALVLPSVLFALVHLGNPNVSPFFTFTNTALAGVWLSVAYWRTRSLWLAFGLHWGWNWMQGPVLGSPVSGLTQLAPMPLLRFEDAGPAWIGGGAYGFEGGAACTLALIVSTLFILRTQLFRPTPELRQYTDGENPKPQGSPLYERQGETQKRQAETTKMDEKIEADRHGFER